jgi:anti-anti-sigma factor
MDVRLRNVGDVSILGLEGHFETVDLPGFSAAVEALLQDGRRKLCLNFARLEFINSTALGYLVDVGKRLEKELEGELVFSEPSRFFEATVRTLELHHMFEIFPTDAEAVAHLGA